MVMKKIALIFLSVFALGVIAAPASATSSHSYFKSGSSFTKSLWKVPAKKKYYSVVSRKSYSPKLLTKKTRSFSKFKAFKKKAWYKRIGKSHSGSTKSVPEIDAASTGIALALLGGIVAIRRERRKA